MNGHFERRKHKRHRADTAVELIWKDESGQRRFECGRVVDCSAGGVAVACYQPLAAASSLILRAPRMGMVALAKVRNCFWRGSRYRMGIELMERAALEPSDPAAEPDYHQLLRAGVAGDARIVDQLYRALAFRYHPDNQESGNAEIFLRIGEAYRILSVSPPPRPEVRIARQSPGLAGPKGIQGHEEMRIAVLNLLYQRRLDDYLNASVSTRDIESLSGFPVDEIGFILWYLREKGAVALCDYSSDYAITAAGVDILESARQPACFTSRPSGERAATSLQSCS